MVLTTSAVNAREITNTVFDSTGRTFALDFFPDTVSAMKVFQSSHDYKLH